MLRLPVVFKNQNGFSHLILIVVIAVVAALGLFFAFKVLPQQGLETSSQTQTASTPKRVGIVRYLKVMDSAMTGFKDGMKELGYEEGKDIVYTDDLADGDLKKVNSIAKGYLDSNVDLVFAISSVAGRGALFESTSSGKMNIPIVYTYADNPVATGLAKDLKSSGNNATGVTVNHSALVAKRLEFLLRIKPETKKVGLFVAKTSDPAANYVIKAIKDEAPKFNLEVVEYMVNSPTGPDSVKEVAQLADKIKSGEIDALMLTPGGPVLGTTENVNLLIALGKRLNIPVIANNEKVTTDGALFTYAHDVYEMGKQASVYVDKVFKGTKPTDIPIEYPRKNNLIINLKTANEIGVTISDDIKALADKIIE